jgi:hypothetical protein
MSSPEPMPPPMPMLRTSSSSTASCHFSPLAIYMLRSRVCPTHHRLTERRSRRTVLRAEPAAAAAATPPSPPSTSAQHLQDQGPVEQQGERRRRRLTCPTVKLAQSQPHACQHAVGLAHVSHIYVFCSPRAQITLHRMQPAVRQVSTQRLVRVHRARDLPPHVRRHAAARTPSPSTTIGEMR